MLLVLAGLYPHHFALLLLVACVRQSEAFIAAAQAVVAERTTFTPAEIVQGPGRVTEAGAAWSGCRRDRARKTTTTPVFLALSSDSGGTASEMDDDPREVR